MPPRARLSCTSRYIPFKKVRRVVYCSDEKAPPQVWPSPAAAETLEFNGDEAFVAEPGRRRHAKRVKNPLIESEAAFDGDASEN